MSGADLTTLALAGAIVGLGALSILWAAVGVDRLARWWEGVREEHQLTRLREAQAWDALEWGPPPQIDETPGQSSGQGLVTVEARRAALRLHPTQTRGTEQDARSL